MIARVLILLLLVRLPLSADAEQDITDKFYETAESSPSLICRQGEPHYEIVEKGVKA